MCSLMCNLLWLMNWSNVTSSSIYNPQKPNKKTLFNWAIFLQVTESFSCEMNLSVYNNGPMREGYISKLTSAKHHVLYEKPHLKIFRTSWDPPPKTAPWRWVNMESILSCGELSLEWWWLLTSTECLFMPFQEKKNTLVNTRGIIFALSFSTVIKGLMSRVVRNRLSTHNDKVRRERSSSQQVY